MLVAYVYGIRAADSAEYFYIGSTKFAVEYRLKQHIDYVRLGYNTNRKFSNKLRKVGFENVVIEVIEECSEHNRYDREYAIISEYLHRGVPLTNALLKAHDIELARQVNKYAEFELEPRHIEAFVEILEAGAARNGDQLHDKLAEVTESTVWHLARKHTDGFLEMIAEVMKSSHEPAEANRQTADLHRRVREVLERHAGGD